MRVGIWSWRVPPPSGGSGRLGPHGRRSALCLARDLPRSPAQAAARDEADAARAEAQAELLKERSNARRAAGEAAAAQQAAERTEARVREAERGRAKAEAAAAAAAAELTRAARKAAEREAER